MFNNEQSPKTVIRQIAIVADKIAQKNGIHTDTSDAFHAFADELYQIAHKLEVKEVNETKGRTIKVLTEL